MAVRTIPFDAGQDQGIEKALLSGRFSLVRNGVLSREGQLRPRPAYTALASTSYGTGTFVAYDLVSYNDRLVALGDVLGVGYATDVFELVEGGAAQWRPTVPSPVVPRLPRATLVRDLPQPPDQREGVLSFGVAAAGGFTALVWNNDDTGNVRGFVMVQKASTGQAVLVESKGSSGTVASEQLHVLELDDRFVVVGLNSAGTRMTAFSYRPLVDESLVDLGTLTNDATYNILAATRAEGSTQFVTVTAATASGVLRTRRWSNAGVNQVPSGGQYANITDALGTIDRLEVHASSTDNRITIGAQTDGTLNLYTFNLTTGAAVGVGPFQPFAAFEVAEFAFCTISANLIYIIATVTGEDEPQVHIRTYNTLTNAFGASKVLTNVRLASTPIVDGSEVVFAVRCGIDADSQSNTLIAVRPTTLRATTPLINKDFEISTSESAHTPNLVKDASTGLWYWANAALAADLQASPRVTEFAMGSPERRQMCQVGALLYIGGGVPCVYDGVHLHECGFLNRPLVVTAEDSIASGGLTIGATYIYKCIWEVLDSDDNVIRSAISANVEYVATATSASVDCTTPLSLRVNAGSSEAGSVVRIKLYRTVAVVEETAPTIVATQPADPPTSPVTGQSIGIYNYDGTSGTFFYITFSGAATTALAIAAEINAVTGVSLTADGATGRIILTSSFEGSDTFMFVYPDPAAVTLGLAPSLTVQGEDLGTSDFTTGDVFHLTGTVYTGLGGDEVGEFRRVLDQTSDEDLRGEQIIYTQAENPLDHHAPGPADLCASGGENIVIAGQPKRDRWTSSKPFATAQGIQFANPGRDKFSRRIRGDIECIIQRDEETVLFTRREVWSTGGSGPGRDGKGEQQRQRLIYGEGGMRPLGWRSALNIKDGTFFQLDSDKLYALQPGGSPEWIGHPVLETLALYPVVVAVCHVRQHQTVAFACQSEDGTDGVILRYDLRRKQWFEDDVGPVSAMAEYDGRLAIVVAGQVLLQDVAFGEGTTPVLTASLGSFTNFGSLGWGAIVMVTVLGQYRGPCTIELQISYDDTVTWVTCGTYTLTDALYTTGQPIELEYTPAIQECSRFALQAIATATEEDSGAAWLIALDIHDDKDQGPARKGQSFTR